jgi:ornithine carbamoyltransferase
VHVPDPMHSSLEHRILGAFDRISPLEGSDLLRQARALQSAARAGTTQPLLRGKNLGLMCYADDELDAALFRRAAEELGARVSHIRPNLSESSTAQEVQHTARMLGRLYDALECQGMARALVQQIGIDAGAPVYDGIASAAHPTAGLADLLGGDSTPADKRRFVLQAVLVSAVA